MSDRDMFDFLDEAQGINVPKRDWMDDKKFVLVNAENIKECIDSCISSGLYALDLETTGLDNRIEPNGHTKDKIVGVCLSPDGITGYYIPVRHVEVKADGSRSMRDCNVPWTVFEKEFRRLMKETAEGNTVAIFHNGKFDQEFLQYPGGEPFLDWDKATCWEDSMLLAYLADSRRRSKQLKYLTDKELGFDQVELKELFPENHKGPYDFSVLDPTEQGVLWYGGGDGIFTFLLHKHFLNQVIDADTDGKTQKGIYVIEKLCVAAIRWMERSRIHVDIDRVKELVQLGQNEWFESIIEVYEEASNILNRDVMPGTYKVLKDSFVGDDFDYLLPQQIGDAKAKAKSVHPDPVIQVKTDGRSWPSVYDVNSPQQLGKMFDEMGVPGLKRTEKSGQVATGKKELDRIVEVAGEEFPFMSRIKRFREINKALSSYLFPMLLDVDPSDSTMRINYRQDGTDTGRFSTPAKDSARGKLIGFPEVNLQSIPSTYNPQRPACMNRLRECITPRKPNSFIVAIDYAGEELRLITNLSREPKWMEEFFHCASCDRTFPKGDGSSTPEPPPPRCPNCGSDKIGDLHTLTGLELYGPEAPEKPEWKALRGYAKGTNFALSYGGGGSAVSRSTGVDKQEGWRIKRQFDRTYSGLRGWWGAQHNFGRKNGFVRTAFGRKYPVPDITHPDGGFRAKAERNSVNGPIQGCLHGESRVPTNLGVRLIRDLSGKTFNVWTGTQWSEGRAFRSGLKHLIHTTLTSGLVMRTSPDHRFRVYEDGGLLWVRQEDLTPNMWVVTDAQGIDLPEQTLKHQDNGSNAHNKKGYEFEGNHEVLWELIGLLIGDGSICKDGFIIHVGGPDAEQQARFYTNRFQLSLGLKSFVKLKPRAEGDERLPMWQVRIWNQAFRDFCRGLGVEDWNTYTKRIPDAVWSQSAAHRAAFLRGYFSVDGCVNAAEAVDVRSTNPDLLMDTHKLLRSLGIRSTVRIQSKRVSVKDRLLFRSKIGFLISGKSERLEAIKTNPWTGQWHSLPNDLIRRIGAVVHASSIYADLPRAQKSAVLRLKAGSGSKPQCLRYLAKLPSTEVPSEIQTLLQYDYEQVKGIEDTGEQVEMFDVEVFDSEHAFVCDGVVVHNSGADMMKIAMVLVYKEMKKREWLDKCMMIATMHDELVFEIDGDILAEAINVIVPIMTSNKFIMKQNWPIPFTCDVEIGANWTVPWDLNAMRYGEVRFVGDKKYYKAEDLPAGYDWDETPSWPATLMELFPEAKKESSTPPPSSGSSSGTDSQSSPQSNEPPPNPGAVGMQPPSTEVGGNFVYRLSAPLTMETIINLSHVISRCRNGGTRKLRLESNKGETLDKWIEELGFTEFLVNDQQFYFLAQEHGL